MTQAKYIVGVDEVGRGPVAGPVCVCAAAVTKGFDLKKELPGLTDSKKLSEKKREEIFLQIEDLRENRDIAYALSYQDAAVIDTRGIEFAINTAVEESIAELKIKTSESFVYLDGKLKAPSKYKQKTVVRGDSLIPSISLASVIAKVHRDAVMQLECPKFPEYGFSTHKGYGTKAHISAIKKHGLTPLHRKTFLTKILGK